MKLSKNNKKQLEKNIIELIKITAEFDFIAKKENDNFELIKDISTFSNPEFKELLSIKIINKDTYNIKFQRDQYKYYLEVIDNNVNYCSRFIDSYNYYNGLYVYIINTSERDITFDTFINNLKKLKSKFQNVLNSRVKNGLIKGGVNWV